MAATYFTGETFGFLRDLKQNNDRDWFQANKARYDDHVNRWPVRPAATTPATP